jgi:hypothetical protein
MFTARRKTSVRAGKAVAHAAAACALAASASVMLAGPASAYTEYPIAVDDCNADFQDCANHIAHVQVPMKAMGINVRFRSAPEPEMCSNIIARLGTDAPTERVLGEAQVAPGKATPSFPITTKDANGRPSVDVSVHAIGVEGGCNTGGLLMWSGVLVVESFGYGLPPKPGE